MSLDSHAPMELERDNLTQAIGPGISSAQPTLLTYQQLLDKYLEGSDGAGRSFRIWAFNIWSDSVGLGPSDVPGEELLHEFDVTLNRIRDQITKTRAKRTGANFSSCMRGLQAVHVAALQAVALPPNLTDAIQFRLNVLGLTKFSIKQKISSAAYHWAIGKSTPVGNPGSLQELHRLEDYLQLPEGTLVSRAPRHRQMHGSDRKLSTDIPYNRYVAVVLKHPYLLRVGEFPESLQGAWYAFVAHKQKDEHFLANGDAAVLRPSEYWSSEASAEARLKLFSCFFGFLVLPKAPANATQLSWEERLDHGLGIPRESLCLTMALNLNYLRAYVDYCQLRTFDQEAFLYEEDKKRGTALGGSPPRRTIPISTFYFISGLKGLVSKPTAFFRLHPEYAREANVSESSWQEWCSARAEELTKLIAMAKQKAKTGKRSTEFSLKELLRDRNPLQAMYEMLVLMRETPPSETSKVLVAAHYRDILLFSLLLFLPLRIKNLHLLRIGKHIVKQQDGSWRLQISAIEFKNFIHGHAEDVNRALPTLVAYDLEKWLELRAKLLGVSDTEQLFVLVNAPTTSTKRVSKIENLSVAIRARTKKYFGLAIGPHALRHLTATAVGRFGTPAQVKAVLNDSAKVAMETYNHARNIDEEDGLDILHSQLSDLTVKKGAK